MVLIFGQRKAVDVSGYSKDFPLTFYDNTTIWTNKRALPLKTSMRPKSFMPSSKNILTLFFFPLLPVLLDAQTFSTEKLGLNIGLHIAFGTHFQRIGLSCAGYYENKNYQINPGVKVYYNFKNIGAQKQYFEVAVSIGALISYGDADSSTNKFITSVSNQTIRKNSFGYSFNYYFNRINTAQATGTVALQFGKVQLICEDDLFAGGRRDEFRTGSFLVQYRDQNVQYTLNFFTGWTGTRGKVTLDPNYPSRNGYMDMSKSLYGYVSAGLISAQVQYAGNYGQIYQANVGVDAEQVRNFFQNKLIHRSIFSLKKTSWRGGNDLPMISSNGDQYLYKEGQKVRRAKPYVNFFVNPSLFY